jgi:hypothetical protein
VGLKQESPSNKGQFGIAAVDDPIASTGIPKDVSGMAFAVPAKARRNPVMRRLMVNRMINST